jgi:hypothetical protein
MAEFAPIFCFSLIATRGAGVLALQMFRSSMNDGYNSKRPSGLIVRIWLTL